MNASGRAQIVLRLKEWRQLKADMKGVELYRVLQNRTIDEIVNALPSTNLELLQINGIGPKKAKEYGPEILSIIAEIKNKGETSSEDSVYSVAEFISRLNLSLSRKQVLIRGEVYDSLDIRGRAVYFKLRDPEHNAIINCFAWKEVLESRGVIPQEGDEIIVSGVCQIYPPSGRFSLQVHQIDLRGEGLLKQAFERLKKKLEEEGLFSLERKRPLPRFCKRIALITAQGSDAERDFITHVGNFGYQIHRIDVRVEGVRSESELCNACRYCNCCSEPYDVVVITRGGGSLEALQAFNSENLVREIVASKIPVISGVGHENDITLCDLVADVRASTPTHAGKILATQWEQEISTFNEYLSDMNGSVQNLLDNSSDAISEQSYLWRDMISQHLNILDRSVNSYIRELGYAFNRVRNLVLDPVQKFNYSQSILEKEFISRSQSIGTTQNLISRSASGLLSSAQKSLSRWDHVLEAYNPEATLKRGFAIVSRKDKGVSSAKNIAVGDKLRLTFHDGSAEANVAEVSPKE